MSKILTSDAPTHLVLTTTLGEIGFLSRNVTHDAKVSGWVKASESLTSSCITPIPDLIGVRVIVRSIDKCYQVVRAIHRCFEYVESSYDDYIEHPKPNGYRSLHTVVLASNGYPVQVQVRTHPMHACAEHGSAAKRHSK